MTAILRQKPGDIALAAGTWDLVGEGGKSAHLPYECKRGERLPSPSVGDDLGPNPHWVLTVPAMPLEQQVARAA